MVAPPIYPAFIQLYFGDLKGFGAVDKLVMIVSGEVPVYAVASEADIERALQYGKIDGRNRVHPIDLWPLSGTP